MLLFWFQKYFSLLLISSIGIGLLSGGLALNRWIRENNNKSTVRENERTFEKCIFKAETPQNFQNCDK